MKINTLNCPACNAPLDAAQLQSNEPFNCPACGSAIILTDWTLSGKLICPNCGTLNGSTSKFCMACEAVLQAGCPFCYTQNSLSAVTCKGCGVNLQKAWKRQKDWLKQREQYSQNQKKALQKTVQNRKAHLDRLLLLLNEPENHPLAIPELLIYGKEAVEPLLNLLASSDPDARLGAAKALGDINDPRAIPKLIDAIPDKDLAVQFWVVDALGRLKAAAAVDAIAALLDHPTPRIRTLARDVLIQIGTDKAFQLLRKKSRRKWWTSL